MKFYTLEEMQEALELHEDFNFDAPGKSYTSAEKTPDGDIICFYVGRIDDHGHVITGYDESYLAK